MRPIHIAVIVAMLAVAVSPALADKGGRKNDPPCTISPSPVAVGQEYVVSVSGLPTDTAINIWVTDANGTVGRPLGSTADGSFALTESSSVAGTTTYAFSGPEKHNTFVYSTCSVEAS
jgi:hypothetical protein